MRRAEQRSFGLRLLWSGRWCWLAGTLIIAGCASSHRQETFGDTCRDDTQCRAPYRCLDSSTVRSLGPRLTCTRTCNSDTDCPDWDDEDDCQEGYRNSSCIHSVCVLFPCEG
jgi:hypothetical protein